MSQSTVNQSSQDNHKKHGIQQTYLNISNRRFWKWKCNFSDFTDNHQHKTDVLFWRGLNRTLKQQSFKGSMVM